MQENDMAEYIGKVCTNRSESLLEAIILRSSRPTFLLSDSHLVPASFNQAGQIRCIPSVVFQVPKAC
jgi:hypothetical protein